MFVAALISTPAFAFKNSKRRRRTESTELLPPGVEDNSAYGYVDYEPTVHICQGAAEKMQELFADSVTLLHNAGTSNEDSLLSLADDIYYWCEDTENNGLTKLLVRQCKGYTALLKEMIKSGHPEVANNFFTAAYGSTTEQNQGCGFIVNTINKDVREGKFEGLTQVKVSGGVFIPADTTEGVVFAGLSEDAVSERLQNPEQFTITATDPSETNFKLEAIMGSGAAAVAAVGATLYYLIELCDDYQELLA